MKFTPSVRSRSRGLNLIEMIVVVAVLGVLATLLFPGMSMAKRLAEAMKNTHNLRQIAVATIHWAADNSMRLPSPEYPGGMTVPPGQTPEDYFPEFWDFVGTGLWLDGVVFGHMYLREGEHEIERPESVGESGGYEGDEMGTHLKGTFFESTQSVRKDPLEEDWHRHSYAMNANLQYDRIYDSVPSENPWLTEKTMSNLIFAPNAMLYIDCIEPNVVMHEDREAIIETIEERWDGSKAIAAFLDGHAERLSEREIPEEDPFTDRESSRFWRGVDPPR